MGRLRLREHPALCAGRTAADARDRRVGRARRHLPARGGRELQGDAPTDPRRPAPADGARTRTAERLPHPGDRGARLRGRRRRRRARETGLRGGRRDGRDDARQRHGAARRARRARLHVPRPPARLRDVRRGEGARALGLRSRPDPRLQGAGRRQLRQHLRREGHRREGRKGADRAVGQHRDDDRAHRRAHPAAGAEGARRRPRGRSAFQVHGDDRARRARRRTGPRRLAGQRLRP